MHSVFIGVCLILVLSCCEHSMLVVCFRRSRHPVPKSISRRGATILAETNWCLSHIWYPLLWKIGSREHVWEGHAESKSHLYLIQWYRCFSFFAAYYVSITLKYLFAIPIEVSRSPSPSLSVCLFSACHLFLAFSVFLSLFKGSSFCHLSHIFPAIDQGEHN